jgi:hypothetical protein
MASVARYCCCDAGGCLADDDSCSTCTDITPNAYTVTFSGVTICGCLNLSPDVEIAYSAGDLNGSFTLYHKNASESDTSCVWELTTSASLKVIQTVYDSMDGSCGGGVLAESDEQVSIILTRTATEWKLQAFNLNNDLFCDTQTADTDDGDQLCATVPSFTNDMTSGCGTTPPASCAVGPPGVIIGATGGTATVVCVEA